MRFNNCSRRCGLLTWVGEEYPLQPFCYKAEKRIRELEDCADKEARKRGRARGQRQGE